jgi:type VI secretion system protein VasG
MVSVNLKSLVSKLNEPCRRALEGAAGLCLSRTHYNVEVEHWLIKLLETSNTDLTPILRQYEVDSSRLLRDLTKATDRFKTGNSRAPALSPNVIDLAREAWLLGSLEYGATRARTGHILLALVSDENMARLAREASPEFEKIKPAVLQKDLPALTANSPEAAQPGEAPGAAAGPGQPPIPGSKTPSLDQYTIDLTAKARKGQIDAVLGRDTEIRQLIDILTRRRQNNPILTGEAGVGKTAVVEGFALRIAAGDVPAVLKNVALRTLDLGLLQAGAGVKGEFENRLKSVIDEVKASPTPIILFIDEAHTMIGAGGQAGQNDAANLLKPALARGELRTIAATTWAEYKKYFERDPALARRFQVVKVEEPGEPSAVEMMRGLIETLEKHHGVRVLDEAVRDSVRLSHRYISGRQLPDKSVSLLDTACARVRLSHTTTPPALEDCRRRIDGLKVAIEALERETTTGGDHAERLAEMTAEKTKAEEELKALEARWKEESRLVGEIRTIRDRLEGKAPEKGEKGEKAPPPLKPDEAEKLRGDLARLTADLRKVQGEEPLMSVCVDSQAIAEVVSNWTGIPVGRMVSDEIQTVLTLKNKLEDRIVGQTHAMDAIAQRIRTARANLTDPKRPIGVFMLVGTSGVGKTETALALADLLYGGEQNLTTINMSEFKEEHKVSLLMGSPPGYVGYGEGGVLTEAVRRRPYSVLLLDEMEKAHPGVQDIFYQVFDKGNMRDGEGRDIDFKNTLIMMTSNAGTDTIHKLFADKDTMPDAAGLAEALRPDLLKVFKPAFLGRVTLVPYFPLAEDVLKQIVELQLGRVKKRVQENYRAKFTYSPDLVSGIAARCTEVESGARNIDHIISRTLLPEMAAEFLERMSVGKPITAVNVTMGENGAFRYEIS